MLTLEDLDLEPHPLDGVTVPLLRMTTGGPPDVDIRVGGDAYHYERSFPIKGHGATLPRYVREQLAANKRLLLVERPDRFLVFLGA